VTATAKRTNAEEAACVPGSRIPIQNIYYLISYAWNVLKEKDELSDVDAGDSPDLVNLFARVLITGTNRLRRRGLDRGYLPREEAIAGVRGKLMTTQTLRAGLLRQGRAVCAWDELEYGTIPNRIIKTTLADLMASGELESENCARAVDTLRWLAPIDRLEIRREHFRRVQLHRNNRIYAFLLHTCELIHEHWLPVEGGTRLRFRDFVRDGLPGLFEKFVLNFYKYELPNWQVWSPVFEWDVGHQNADAIELIPRMETDVCLKGPDRAIVIDTKFYTEALRTGQYGGQRLSTSNLYQLFTYLRQRSVTPGWERADGVLLYPKTSRAFSAEFVTHGHRIRAMTVDLELPWREISASLLEMVHA
jgi:5-methylcytosine-specific restriction enzyme subunit McrC